MKDQNVKEKFIALRAKGLSFDKISRELNVSKPVLIDWCREYENEIANLKAVEFDTIIEKYSLNKKGRIELYAMYVKKIVDELANRDFSTVQTCKLVELLIKLCNSLKDEGLEQVFTGKRSLLESSFTQRTTWSG